jgi:sugar-specific transcriptional regulator TrmB
MFVCCNMKNTFVDTLAILDLDNFCCEVWWYMKNNPHLNLTQVARKLSCSRPKLYRAIESLKDCDLVFESDGKLCYRSFQYANSLIQERIYHFDVINTKYAKQTQFWDQKMTGGKSQEQPEKYIGKSQLQKLMRQVHNDLHPGDYLYWILESKKLYEIIPLEFIIQLSKSREKKKVVLKIIATSDNTDIHLLQTEQNLLEVKVMRSSDASHQPITISPTQIVFWNLNREEATVIRDPLIINGFKLIFEELWGSI